MADSSNGIWQEGGFLDVLDKGLSRWYFHVELPWALETALSIPGMWFCCGPFFSSLAVPMVLLCLAPQSKTFLFMVCIPVLVTSLSVWVKLCTQSANGSEGVQLAYMHGQDIGGLLFVGLPHVVMLIAGFGAAVGREAVAHFYMGFMATLKVVGRVKHVVGRARPMAALAAELKAVRRVLADASRQQSRPSEVFLSFPSGDAAVAAVFAMVALSLLPGPRGRTAALMVMPLASFGRMYFHCHHFLDVVVGTLFGMTFAVLLGKCFKRPAWWQVFVAQILFAVLPL